MPAPDGSAATGAKLWPGFELQRSALFTDVRQLTVARRLSIPSADYIGLLSTISAHLQLAERGRLDAFAFRWRLAHRSQAVDAPGRSIGGVTQVRQPRADRISVESSTTKARGAFGVVATVALVVLVVTGEFLLLTGVYHRGDDVRKQQVIAARLDGRVQAPLDAGTRNAAAADLDALASAGLGAGDVARMRSALASGDVNSVRDAVHRENSTLADRSSAIDEQAELIYVALLVAASLGWMAWFRRLVARHRELQRRITAQQARVAGEQRLAALVHNSSDVIALLDADSRITFITPSAQQVLGWEAAELIGRRWIDEVMRPDETGPFVHALAAQRPEITISMQARHRGGASLYLEGGLVNLMDDPSVGGLVLTVRDVTERRALEEQLTHHAFHDDLTGLANRRLFAERLGHAIRRRTRVAARGAVVVFFDLDDFKQINDSVGHGVGDQVLVQVAARLTGLVRPGDTAARLGGDEFAILMEDSDIGEAHLVAQRLQQALSVPVVLDGTAHRVAASVGLAAADVDDMSWQDVLRNADVAMYLAKERGKSGIAVYEAVLHAESLERMQLRADLQRALRDDELVLYFQPAVELSTGDIVGFEALVRWQRPGHGLVGPGAFIPEAERCGLIVPLGAWVLRSACAAARTMQHGLNTPSMSVNVAAAQLAREDFVHEVFAVLDETGLPADRLCLEITETSLMRDLDRMVERLAQLRARGVRVAVDDFGTGYSSLSYLSKLPVDVLKVDRSFIERVTLDEQDASVTRAILAMSSAMHLTTVAEGIESEDQANWLAAANCATGQGFLWSAPVPFSTAKDMLAAWQSERGSAVTTPRTVTLHSVDVASSAPGGPRIAQAVDDAPTDIAG